MIENTERLRQIFVLSYYELDTFVSKKLNNWINTSSEINRFQRRYDDVKKQLNSYTKEAEHASLNHNGNEIVSQLIVSEAANMAARAKSNYNTAAKKANENKMKVGFRDYAYARDLLYQIARDYSLFVDALFTERIKEVTTNTDTTQNDNVRTPSDNIEDNLNNNPPLSDNNNAVSSNAINGLLLIVGAIALYFIFKKKKK